MAYFSRRGFLKAAAGAALGKPRGESPLPPKPARARQGEAQAAFAGREHSPRNRRSDRKSGDGGGAHPG